MRINRGDICKALRAAPDMWSGSDRCTYYYYIRWGEFCAVPSVEVNKASAYIKVVAEVDRACMYITGQELFF